MSEDRFGREDGRPEEDDRPSLFKDPAASGQWAPPQPGRGDVGPVQPLGGGWTPPAGTQQAPPHGQQDHGQQPPPYGQPGPVLHLAGYGDRVAAALVDFIVTLAIFIVGAGLGALLFIAGEDAGIIGILVGTGLALIPAIAYQPVMMARTNGQTLGHRSTNTRVVNVSLQPMDGGKAFVREFLVKGLLLGLGGSFLLFGLPTLLNYLWPLWDEGSEALHDKICSTRVVRAD